MLFHAPGSEYIAKSICHQNFDPRLHRADSNRVLNGKGTYFAQQAKYSHVYIPRSSKREENYMFLANVLVGRYVKGNPTMSRPPEIPGLTYELYDSTVDNIKEPKCYVIYDNLKCYPTFLIRYRDLKRGDQAAQS